MKKMLEEAWFKVLVAAGFAHRSPEA